MTLSIPSLILQQELSGHGPTMLKEGILAKAPHFWSIQEWLVPELSLISLQVLL